MTEAMKSFLEMASKNEEIRNQVEALRGQEEKRFLEQVIALAAKQGISLTEQDFEPDSQEMDEAELAAVTGGARSTCLIAGVGGGDSLFDPTDDSKSCFCVAAGYGR